jgi:hypothetical protein
MGANARIFFLSISFCADFSPSPSLPISLSVFRWKKFGNFRVLIRVFR